MYIDYILEMSKKKQTTHSLSNLLDVYNEAERYDLDRSTAEDIIETLCQLGRMLRPSGYDTLQIS